MSLTRRTLLTGSAGAAALTPFVTLAQAIAQTAPAQTAPAQTAPGGLAPTADMEAAMARARAAHDSLMGLEGLKMRGAEQIVMVLYPGFTALDLVGPQYMFASMMGATVHLAAQSMEDGPVMSDTGLAIQPTIALADCPPDPDLLFLPGGATGTAKALENEALITFVRDTGAKAGFVTSVCTGSLLLGQAGLLRGKRATSHWVTRPILRHYGAEPVDARVVRDGNVITGAGVSAGLDFGLSILAGLRGEAYAQAIQLQAEYAPEPPFDAGTPSSAPQVLAEGMAGMFAPLTARMETTARSWAKQAAGSAG